ncbi:MAG: glucokinase [Alphaproteobacteria bacterium]
MAGPGASSGKPVLIADIGGTNARFGLADSGAISAIEVLQTSDFPHMAAAIRAYLDRVAPEAAPERAALAIAAPVIGDHIHLINNGWSFSIDELRRTFGFKALRVVNDFAAIALAVPHLAPGDMEQIGGGDALCGAPSIVIGPGTGLGISALVWDQGRPVPISTEGGHATLTAVDEREDAVIAHLRARFGHVSIERCVSGPGLVNIYGALAGGSAADLTPADVTGRALAGSDARCVEALRMFCAMLGTVAGNLALGYGALGGVYIAGGIVLQLGDFFAASEFRARFEAKGRFTAYNSAIPTRVITARHPAFTGLVALLED